MSKVGIPRALLYYQYFPLWKTFFTELGAEVVVSPPTTKAILAAGAERVVAETCLPVKVFCGHVLQLVDRVDFLFIPAVRSLEPRVLNCSKFLGLPDMVRCVIPEAPTILEPDIDLDQKSSEDKFWRPPGTEITPKARRAFYRAVYELGRHFTPNPLRIKAAAERAFAVHNEYLGVTQTGLTALEGLRQMGYERAAPYEGSRTNLRQTLPGPPLCVAVVGHPYNLYDTYTNHNLLARLRKMGVEVVTAEMASPDELRQGTIRLVGEPYWTYEDEVVGAAGHYLADDRVQGIIVIVSFGCGPDSTFMDVVQRACRSRRKPYMALVIDEHTGEAGLITRLEAFVDMLARKEQKKRTGS